MKNGRLKQK